MNIIDLFSGAGGLTFGFYYDLIDGQFVRNNNNFVFANEKYSQAANAFSENFKDIHMEICDIHELTEEKIKKLISNRLPEGEEIDLIIGGPPCQSFSTVGQRIYDDKAKLYEEYLRIINIVRPKMFLFENVKGILSMRETFYEKDENGEIKYRTLENSITKKQSKRPIISGYGEKIMEIIKHNFATIDNGFGYKITDKVLNAVNYRQLYKTIVANEPDEKLSLEMPKPNCREKTTFIQAMFSKTEWLFYVAMIVVVICAYFVIR